MTPKQCDKRLRVLREEQRHHVIAPIKADERAAFYVKNLWIHKFETDPHRTYAHSMPTQVSFYAADLGTISYDDFFYCITLDDMEFIEYVVRRFLEVCGQSFYETPIMPASSAPGTELRTVPSSLLALLMTNAMMVQFHTLLVAACDMEKIKEAS